MIDTETIDIQKITESRLAQTDFSQLKFGRTFSDHMFCMDYRDGAWQKPHILPYQNMSMAPSASVIHYGQSAFEGMKAYKNADGKFGLFRPDQNIKRMNISAERLCMPKVPEDIFMEALQKLIRLDQAWIPTDESSSLYIRPVLFALDEYIGVKPSSSYRFMIFTSPVNAYYSEPVKVKVERHYTRAARGGTGFAKAAGNYAGSLYPAKLANEQGYDQLLWTDSKEHKYIEESGTMNVMFVVDGKLLTPELSDSILDGITRKSVITLAKDWGIPVEERRISVEEILKAADENRLEEAFGCGTAATIAHIAAIVDEELRFDLPDVGEREVSGRLQKYFTDLKKFRIDDKHGWMLPLN